MTSYIESSPIDIGDGDRFSLIQRVVPDLTFDGSTSASTPAATFTIKARNFPGDTFDQTSSQATTRSSTSPVEQFTNKLDFRIRGRAFVLRIDSSSLGCRYKLGTPRIDIRQDGKR